MNKNKVSFEKLIKRMILAGLFLLLISLFESYINYFVGSYLGNLNYSLVYTKLFFIITVALLFVLLASRIKVFNIDYFINTVFIVLVYTLYRANIIPHNYWCFSLLFSPVFYLDAVYLLPIVVLKPQISKLISWITKLRISFSSKRNNAMLRIINVDHPIENKDDDKFKYYDDAEKLLKIIINNKYQTTENALVIGLQGEWGRGKTTYLNMLKIAAETNHKDDVLVLRFNPWLNHSYNQLAQNFLGTIGEEINDISIKNDINRYTKKIITADICWVSKIASFITGEKNQYADELFNDVSDNIEKLNKLLIIQVDDIDRLTGEEIFNTLKLVRNVANFKNTVFIVAYDKDYVAKALLELKINEKYLEKIFNIPYYLPAVRKKELIDIISNLLKTSLQIKEEQYKIIDEFMGIVSDSISIRNAKRLLSVVHYSWSSLLDSEGELMVDLLDYLLINYLGMINTNAYEYLSSYKIEEGYVSNEIKPLLTVSGDEIILYMNKDFFHKEILSEEEYKKERLEKIIGENNLSLVHNIFKELFGIRKGIARISYINSFFMYFERSLEKKLVCQKEFYKAFNNGSEFFRGKLKDWNDYYDTHSLDRLISNMKLDSKEEWERAFCDVLTIAPLRYLDWIYSKFRGGKKRILPEPGADLLNEYNSNVYNEKKLCSESLIAFLFNEKMLNSDSLEVIQKKFALILAYEKLLSIAFDMTKQGNIALSDKDIFELYWKRYNELGINYEDFNEDFWYILENIHFNEKLEVREVLKSHISEHIEEFIKYYTFKKLPNSQIYQIFREYTVTGETNASGRNIWLPGFIDFLKDIKPDSEELRNYINDCNKLTNVV